MPPVDRGEFFVNINYPTGTPLVDHERCGAQSRADRAQACPDLQSETSIAGAYEGALTGYINNGAIGQIHVFLKTGRHQLDPVLVAAAREPDSETRCRARK